MLLLALLLSAPQPISLAEALARAAQANPDVAVARLNVRVAEAGIQSAGQLSNPTVSGSYGPDAPTWIGAIDLKLPVLGQRGTAVAAAERERDTARAEVATRELTVQAAARRAYFALAAAQAQAQFAAEASKLSRELEEMSIKKFETGSAPRLEVEQAGVTRRQAEQEQLDRETAANTAQVELGKLLGTESELQAQDPLLPIPEAPPLAQLIDRAAQHPEVQSLRRQQDAALARAQRERTAVRPLPDVAVAFQGGEPAGAVHDPSQPTIGVRYTLAFELPILSWNGGRIGAEVAQASVAAAQAAAAEQRLRNEIRAARARWEAASKRARAYAEELVPAALRLLEMARTGYQLGRAPLYSVLQAQGEVTAARVRGVDAASEAQKAFADLEEAAGETF
jgi:cobalt-zinc-cadmium efflux system outer membrane protein